MADLVIVTGMGPALAQLLQAETIYLAVGEGLSAWDSATPIPQPTTAQATLQNELARAIATVSYLDDSNRVVAGPTRRLECVASFGVGLANGTLREMGLYAFGSGTLGSGTLIAAANFAAVSKPAGGGDYTLARTMRLVFLGAL